MNAHPTAPVPTSSTPVGPLQRYLRDPGGALQTLLDHVRAWATGPGLIVGPLVLALVVAVLVGRAWWWRSYFWDKF